MVGNSYADDVMKLSQAEIIWSPDTRYRWGWCTLDMRAVTREGQVLSHTGGGCWLISGQCLGLHDHHMMIMIDSFWFDKKTPGIRQIKTSRWVDIIVRWCRCQVLELKRLASGAPDTAAAPSAFKLRERDRKPGDNIGGQGILTSD